MILYQVYEVTPAPWGDKYRFIEQYTDEEDAEELLRCLNELNVLHNYYKIVEWEE